MFSHCKSTGPNDPLGGAIFDLSSMVGRTYKEDQYTLLHTKKLWRTSQQTFT